MRIVRLGRRCCTVALRQPVTGGVVGVVVVARRAADLRLLVESVESVVEVVSPGAATTVDPRDPGKATRLVAGGVYRLSRNPMYLGLLCTMTAWAVYLGSPWSLLILPIYVWYITRFQILPEEAALHRLFGASYVAYCARVRRWI